MTKNFCDVCGTEMTDRNRPKGGTSGRLGTTTGGLEGKKVMFEVTTGIDDCWNKGEICKHCIIDAIRALDDRPKCAPAPVDPKSVEANSTAEIRASQQQRPTN